MHRPEWTRHGRDWPFRETSSFVHAGGLRWHVQRAGSGPAILLLHGSGAATHSWAPLLPLLTDHFAVTAPDLPGHGFTEAPPPSEMSLDGVANRVAALLDVLGVAPAIIVGHSAGAAVAARLALDGNFSPAALIGLNPALAAVESDLPAPFAPLLQRVFTGMFVARLTARIAAQPGMVDRVLAGTGSNPPELTRNGYRRLAASPAHVHATLSMMANWRLDGLRRDLPRLDVPFLLVLGDGDRWIPARPVEQLARRLPLASIETIPGTGHLSHEERPTEVARLICALAREVGALPEPRTP